MLKIQTHRSGKSGPENGERNEGQGRRRQITIGESASEYSGGQLRRNDAGDQDCETDIPEPVQYEDRPERFRAFPFAYRQMYCAAKTPHARKPKATVMPQIRRIGLMRSFLRIACKSLYISRRGESRSQLMIESASETRANIARYVEEPGVCLATSSPEAPHGGGLHSCTAPRGNQLAHQPPRRALWRFHSPVAVNSIICGV
jgi:hypothetical protein